MNKNIKILLEWYKLARPNRRYFIIDVVIILFGVLCVVIAPIYAAKVITNLTKDKYAIALVCLSYYYLFISAERFLYIVKYKIYSKLIGSIYLPLQEKIYDKIIDCDEMVFNDHSKGKILHIYHEDALTLSHFADMITSSFSKIIRIILTLSAVLIINYKVAIVLFAINIINYFIYNKLAKKQAKANQETYETTDEEYDVFASILDSKTIIKGSKEEKNIKEKFIEKNKRFIASKDKHSMSNSSIENLYYIYNNIIVYLFTLTMVWLLSNNELTLTLYLIIIPYIASGIETFNNFYNYLTELNKVDVAMKRINIILNLPEKNQKEKQ